MFMVVQVTSFLQNIYLNTHSIESVIKLSCNALMYEIKRWNALLTQVKPKQDCSDQQGSKLLLISHWWERPKRCAETAVTWCHSRLSRWHLWLSRWPFSTERFNAIMRFWGFKLQITIKYAHGANGRFPNRTLYLQNIPTCHWYHSYTAGCSLF